MDSHKHCAGLSAASLL